MKSTDPYFQILLLKANIRDGTPNWFPNGGIDTDTRKGWIRTMRMDGAHTLELRWGWDFKSGQRISALELLISRESKGFVWVYQKLIFEAALFDGATRREEIGTRNFRVLLLNRENIDTRKLYLAKANYHVLMQERRDWWMWSISRDTMTIHLKSKHSACILLISSYLHMAYS